MICWLFRALLWWILLLSFSFPTDFGLLRTVSGTSISFGSAVTYSTQNPAYTGASFDTSAGKTVTAFTAQGGSNYATAIVGTVSGTSISFGSAVVFRSANTQEFACVYDTNADKTVICYRESSVTGAGEGIVGTVSGTSISFGSAVQFDSAPVTVVRGAYDSATNQVICAYTKATTKVVLGTVSGTSISFGAIVSAPTSNSSAYNGVCYDSNVNKIVLTYAYGGASPYSNGTIATGTVSGTTLSFASPVATFNPTTVSEHIAAVYDSTNKKSVIAYGENNASGEALVFQAAGTASTSNSADFIGITAGAISDTATGAVNVYGGINEAQTGLTIGSDYYVQDDGRIASGVENAPYDISGATYDSKVFNAGSQESAAEGLAFNADGTKMFIVGSGSDTVYEYNLTTAFDISTAAYNSVSFSVASQETTPGGLDFSPDGTKMYIAGYTNDTVFQYTLSTAFDLSTASYSGLSFDVSAQENGLQTVVFNPAGSKMYIRGFTNNTFFQYSLSTPHNVSTASYDSVSFTPTAQGSQPISLAFNADGTKCFVANGDTDAIFQYSLSSAYNVGTASYDSISLSVSAQNNQPKDIAFSTDGDRLFLIGQAGGSFVYQYSTTALAYSTTVKAGQAISATTINMMDLT